MSVDRELAALHSQLAKLSETVRHEQEDATSRLIGRLIDEIAALRDSVSRVPQMIEETVEKLRLDVDDRLVDILASQNRQSAVLSAIADDFGRHTGYTPDESGVRALIATHDQLSQLIDTGATGQTEVLAGQRRNLERTLAQLAVVPVAVGQGRPFDPATMRSDAQTIDSDQPALDGMIAELITTGWESAAGGHVVRLAQVRVYTYRPAESPSGISAHQQTELADSPSQTQKEDTRWDRIKRTAKGQTT